MLSAHDVQMCTVSFKAPAQSSSVLVIRYFCAARL